MLAVTATLSLLFTTGVAVARTQPLLRIPHELLPREKGVNLTLTVHALNPRGPSSLTIGDAARMIRDALKDKSYRSTPLGLEIARYIRWKRNEWGARPDTIRDYEPALARLALFFADLELRDFETPVGAERLRECWDYHWGDKTARTRAKILSIWRDFFDWAIREGRA